MAHKHLSRDFETLVFAHDSYPVILFPTSRSRYFENKDFKARGACHAVNLASVRLSKGKMMRVDFNENKTWVGLSVAFHL